MFVRLTLADVKEGEMDNALEYVKNTVMPSYDGISGLLQIAACATNDGRFMAWSTWANEEAKEASIDKSHGATITLATCQISALTSNRTIASASCISQQSYIHHKYSNYQMLGFCLKAGIL